MRATTRRIVRLLGSITLTAATSTLAGPSAGAAVDAPPGASARQFAHRAAEDRPARTSGRFVLDDDQLYDRPGDYPRLDLRPQRCRGTNLFGPVAVCSRADGTVLVWNVARVRSRTNPWVIRDRADGAVAVWGSGVAWHRSDGSTGYRGQDGTIMTLDAGGIFDRSAR